MQGSKNKFLDEVKLPTLESKNHLKIAEIDRVFATVGCEISGLLLRQSEFQKFDTALNILLESYREINTFQAESLKILFQLKGLFLGGEINSSAKKVFARELSHVYSKYYLIAENSEERNSLLAQLWVLLNPISLINFATSYTYQVNPAVGKVLLKKLSNIVEQRYEIDLENETDFANYQLIQPLLRHIEFEDRTEILVEFLSFQRDDLGSQNISLWLDLAQGLSSMSNDLSISLLRNSFEYGKKEEPAVSKFFNFLNEIKGNPDLEDQAYQNYLDSQFEDIGRILLKFKSALPSFKNVEDVITAIEALKHELILKLTLVINVGSSLFNPENIKTRVQNSFKDIALSDKNSSFELVTLNALIPIGIVTETESLGIDSFRMTDGQASPLFVYLDAVKTLARLINEAVEVENETSLFNNLLIALDSPVRTYYILGYLEVNKIIDLSKKSSRLSPLMIEGLVQFILLEKENNFYKNVMFYRGDEISSGIADSFGQAA